MLLSRKASMENIQSKGFSVLERVVHASLERREPTMSMGD
jgi:hypothetical protein